MVDPLSASTREACRKHSVSIAHNVVFGYSKAKETLLESPVSIQQGIYDIDFIGAYSYMGGRETRIRHVSSIGRFCSIANNLVSGQPEHPTDFLSGSPVFTGSLPWGNTSAFHDANREMVTKAARTCVQSLANRSEKIRIGNDVWIGDGVFIRRGVTIGDGAVIGARSVVTSDVPPYAIVGGTPARIIRFRFEPEVVDALLMLQWWNYGLSALDGVDFTDIYQAITMIDRNIASGKAQLYSAPLVNIGTDGQATTRRYDAQADKFVAYEDTVPDMTPAAIPA